jgi:hypothetical protein
LSPYTVFIPQLKTPEKTNKEATSKHVASLFVFTGKTFRLPHAAGHLQLDQAVQFDRVLHWEFFRDRLDEAVDD